MDSLVWRIAAIGVAGACGAIARYLVVIGCGELLGPRFAYGVLLVNVAGCVAIGLLLGICLNRNGLLSETTQLALAVGLLGGLTTFSSFGYDTLIYLQQQRWGTALTNVAANVVLGIGGCWCGTWLADLMTGKS